MRTIATFLALASATALACAQGGGTPSSVGQTTTPEAQSAAVKAVQIRSDRVAARAKARAAKRSAKASAA